MLIIFIKGRVNFLRTEKTTTHKKNPDKQTNNKTKTNTPKKKASPLFQNKIKYLKGKM